MKVVSYNICESKPWKIEFLLGLEADVLVVPEITCPEEAHLSDDYEMKWLGMEYFFQYTRWKGLGIIWKKGTALVPDWFKPNMNYAIPLVIEDYMILGVWPTKPTSAKSKKTYPQIAQDIIGEYAQHFKDYKTLVIGDFNCYVNQYDKTKKYGDMLNVDNQLESYGFHSLYHQQTGELFGRETVATYFHRFQENAPFFLDYAYTNFPVASFRMFPWNKEMSDHVGLEVIM